MKLTEDWLREHFEYKWLDETDSGAGMYYFKNLGLEDDDFCLLSGDKNGFLEVMLFPYDYIRYQTIEQVEAVYKAITGKDL